MIILACISPSPDPIQSSTLGPLAIFGRPFHQIYLDCLLATTSGLSVYEQFARRCRLSPLPSLEFPCCLARARGCCSGEQAAPKSGQYHPYTDIQEMNDVSDYIFAAVLFCVVYWRRGASRCHRDVNTPPRLNNNSPLTTRVNIPNN